MPEPDPNYPKEDYLGDGVYATWDGHAVILDLRGQDSTTRVVLDSNTFANLRYFVRAHTGKD